MSSTGSQPVAYACSATVTWCGAWGSNPPGPACRAGDLARDRAPRREESGGAAVNRTRFELLIRERRSPYRPAPSVVSEVVARRGVAPPRLLGHCGLNAARLLFRHLAVIVRAVRDVRIELTWICVWGRRAPRVLVPRSSCRVGVSGLEPPVSRSRSARFRQTKLHPGRDGGSRTPVASLMRAASRHESSR